LITYNLINLDFLEEHTHGFESFKEEALSWGPKRVEEVTGINWEKIEELCMTLSENKPFVFMIGLGLNKSMTGAESCRAVSLLPALLGQHRGFYYTNSRGRYIGGDSSGLGLTSKEPKVVSMISLGKRLAAGDFKFVYVFGMNPALTLPDSRNIINGFQRADVFLVVHDTHFTETGNNADVILPATTYLEKDDIYVSDSHPFVRLGKKAILPVAESIDEHLLMKALAEKMEVPEPWIYADPWEEMNGAFKDAFIDGSFEELLHGKTLEVRHKPMTEYQTSTGKLEFSSSNTPKGVSCIPIQMKIKVEEDEFIMLNSALPKYTHTQFKDVYGEIPCIAWINLNDIEKHGLDSKTKATLYNEIGELNVDLKPTDAVPEGVIWCPRELIDSEGNSQNSLANGKPQLIGGGPMFNTIRVRIKQ
jgi:anaerobic selenocysteine-containing dehydrogenase